MQEYERAVIFRLGRLKHGGARGPGIFFIIPCIESFKKIDLRVVSFDVPPQEVFVPNINVEGNISNFRFCQKILSPFLWMLLFTLEYLTLRCR